MKRSILLVLSVLCWINTFGQSTDSLFYRHSLQFNIAGLGFARYGIAYELRLTSHHALFVQGGGTIPYLSDEEEYGFGLHYKYYFRSVHDAKFLWLFKSDYKNTFADINVRYMNLNGIHDGSRYFYEASFIGIGVGQIWIWNSGITISYWLGYGPALQSDYKWKNNVPTDGGSWAKSYKNASGLDFGLSIGYSF